MVNLQFSNIELLKRTHYEAVLSYVSKTMRQQDKLGFYQSVVALPGLESNRAITFDDEDFSWLEKFILADFSVLSNWVEKCPELLRFLQMKKLYVNRFSNGEDTYVNRENTYNAYALFRLMGIKVCPYCETEYIQVFSDDGFSKRTVEFDHFFPKGDDEYPGLAMCFYNLIPCCKQCNQIKMTSSLAANPYDETIESMSYFSTSLPLGINMENVSEQECEPLLNTSGGMILNAKTLLLQKRYAAHAPIVRRWLLNKQKFDDEKLSELERMGFSTVSEMKYSLFGNPRFKSRGNELHTKLKEDLIGY